MKFRGCVLSAFGCVPDTGVKLRGGASYPRVLIHGGTHPPRHAPQDTLKMRGGCILQILASHSEA